MLIGIGAKVVSPGRYVIYQMVKVALSSHHEIFGNGDGADNAGGVRLDGSNAARLRATA
jgi:hypothetical protein